MLAPWDVIGRIATNPRFASHRCRLRLSFIPADIHKMADRDPDSFLYLYRQSVCDVTESEFRIFRVSTFACFVVALFALDAPHTNLIEITRK